MELPRATAQSARLNQIVQVIFAQFLNPLIATVRGRRFSPTRFICLILLGQLAQGRILFVSYMERSGSIRLISAREVTPSERRAYEQN